MSLALSIACGILAALHWLPPRSPRDSQLLGVTRDPWHSRSFSSRGIAEFVVIHKTAISVMLLSLSILSSLAAEVEFHFSVYKTVSKTMSKMAHKMAPMTVPKTPFDVFLIAVFLIATIAWVMAATLPIHIIRLPRVSIIPFSLRPAISRLPLPARRAPTRRGGVTYPLPRLPRSRWYQRERSPVRSGV
jgi:hypothetical protein